MYNECRYIRVSGARCRSAALKGKVYCYFHLHNRRSVPIRTDAIDALTLSPVPDAATLTLPLLEDRSSVQLAITQVLSAIAANQIDNRRAGLLLYGLQIASQNAAHPGEIVDSQPVRSISHTAEGEDMAPAVTQKDHWDYDDDDDEDDEKPLVSDGMKRYIADKLLGTGSPDGLLRQPAVTDLEQEQHQR